MNTLPGKFTQTIANTFGDAGVEWLARLSALIAACEQTWSIRALPPHYTLSYNYVAPAVRADGTEAILKIGVPNPELDTEIEALLIYDGRGCVKLLQVDRDRGAMLLERLAPGTPLAEVRDDEAATRIAARVMRQLWRPVPPDHSFPTVHRWARGLVRMRNRFGGATGPLPEVLVEKAEGLFTDLLASMAAPALLHGDLHHENILRARRQPWLAIDPKGLVGEPAYEVGAHLRNLPSHLLAQPRPERFIARRVDILAEELDLDRDRLLGWGLAQAVLAAWWCLEDNMECWALLVRYAELVDRVMG